MELGRSHLRPVLSRTIRQPLAQLRLRLLPGTRKEALYPTAAPSLASKPLTLTLHSQALPTRVLSSLERAAQSTEAWVKSTVIHKSMAFLSQLVMEDPLLRGIPSASRSSGPLTTLLFTTTKPALVRMALMAQLLIAATFLSRTQRRKISGSVVREERRPPST